MLFRSDTAREQGTKYTEVKARAEKRYSPAELAEVYRTYAKEEVRGATPRYWQDVEVGDPLPTLAKGPMTVTGFIAYAQGWGGLYIRANKLAWRMIHTHPGLGIPNRFNIPDCPERVHWEQEFALKVGAPGAYDYGPERCSWLTHHLTNWMGDDGFLVSSMSKIRRHNPEGDVLMFNGEVLRKFVDQRNGVGVGDELRSQVASDEATVRTTDGVEQIAELAWPRPGTPGRAPPRTGRVEQLDIACTCICNEDVAAASAERGDYP